MGSKSADALPRKTLKPLPAGAEETLGDLNAADITSGPLMTFTTSTQ